MPIKGILASSASKVAKFWSYPTTTVTGSRFNSVDASSLATIAGGQASNGTDNDNFLVSYDKSGVINYQFIYNGSVAGSDIIRAVAIDSSRNAYVASGGPSTTELFTKYNSAGSQQWAQTTSYSMSIGNLKIDSSGNIYVVGSFKISTTNYQFVMKLSSTPSVTWVAARNVGTNAGQTDVYQGVAIDSASNVLVSGYSVIASTSNYNAAQLYKFNSAGALQWGKTVGDGNLGDGSAFLECGVDSSDNVYAVGFRTDNTVANLVKFNSAGTLQWTRHANTSAYNAISVDSSGNSYVLAGSVIAKFDTSGTLQWQRSVKYNTTLNTVLSSIKYDAANNIVYVGGYIGGSGGYAFFASLPADGSGTGTYTLGSYTVNYAASSSTITSPTVTYASSTYTPFTTAPSLSNVGTTQTTTTYTNNKTVIV